MVKITHWHAIIACHQFFSTSSIDACIDVFFVPPSSHIKYVCIQSCLTSQKDQPEFLVIYSVKSLQIPYLINMCFFSAVSVSTKQLSPHYLDDHVYYSDLNTITTVHLY